MMQFSIHRAAAPTDPTPTLAPPTPLIVRLRSLTTAPGPVASNWVTRPPLPLRWPPQSIVTDLLKETPPYWPESTQLISPPASVTPKAKAKVAHGAARVQAPASVPLLATQVRGAASAGMSGSSQAKSAANPHDHRAIVLMSKLPYFAPSAAL